MQRQAGSNETQKLSPIKGLPQKAGSNNGALIPILQQAQENYGYLPEKVLEEIAVELRLPRSVVFGVATFYKQFRLKPSGRYIITVCDGTACHVNGSTDILQAVTEKLGIGDGETTADRLFTIQSVACLGCCSLSPAMMINGETYGNLTKEKVLSILAAIRENES